MSTTKKALLCQASVETGTIFLVLQEVEWSIISGFTGFRM